MTSEVTAELLPGGWATEAADAAALLARWRPGAGSWFAGPHGGLLTVGTALRLDDPDEAGRVLAGLAGSAAAPAVVVGALPFDPAGPAALVVPERVVWAPPLVRSSVGAAPGADRGRWRSRPLPEPAGYEAMVAGALERMAAGGLDKVVLARVLDLACDEAIDQPAMLHELAVRNLAGYVFAVDLPADTAARSLIGASPELLLSRRDGVVVANPLAGSAPRRRDPDDDAAAGAALLASAKDRHEHALVVDEVAGVLGAWCDDLDVPSGPSLIRTDALWHLSTTIRGRSAAASLDVARALHPTPAVGGVPREAARRAIRDLEPFSRDFYTGMVGWMDASGDGEWVIALRCGEVSGASARLYAGAGIVPGSVPSAELAETTTKLETMLASL